MLNINLNYLYAPWASLEMDMLRFINIVIIIIIIINTLVKIWYELVRFLQNDIRYLWSSFDI